MAAEQRAREVLLEQPDDLPVRPKHLVATAELEHRLRLDHEQVLFAVGVEPEADVLLDLHLLLPDEEQRSALVRRAWRGNADPILVRDRLEDLLDEEAVRTLDLSENLLRIGGGRAHRSILSKLGSETAGREAAPGEAVVREQRVDRPQRVRPGSGAKRL